MTNFAVCQLTFPNVPEIFFHFSHLPTDSLSVENIFFEFVAKFFKKISHLTNKTDAMTLFLQTLDQQTDYLSVGQVSAHLTSFNKKTWAKG